MNKIPALFLPPRSANEKQHIKKAPASNNQPKKSRSSNGNKKENNSTARLVSGIK
jgi:hypothetical protein